MLLLLTSVALTCLTGSDSTTGQDAVGGPPGSDVALISKIRSELRRLETGRSSDFFAALSNPDNAGNPNRLTGEQAELIRRLDDVGRDSVRIWLTRLLKEGTPSLAADQVEPIKDRIIAHAEAVAREAILTPAQARRWRTTVTRPAVRPLAGRYPLFPKSVSDNPPPDTLARARNEIWCEAVYVGRPGGEPPASELFTAVLAGGKDAIPALTAEQSGLIRRLEKLARDAQREWLLRGISKEQPPKELWNEPPTREMVDRVSDRGMQHRASVVAHAETIALNAILAPEQAEASKCRMWRRTGVFALFDPELAARLGLSRAQREEIATQLEARAVVWREEHDSRAVQSMQVGHAELSGQLSRAERQQLDDQLRQVFDGEVARYDQSVWDVLRPSQLRALKRILSSAPASRSSLKAARANRPG